MLKFNTLFDIVRLVIIALIIIIIVILLRSSNVEKFAEINTKNDVLNIEDVNETKTVENHKYFYESKFHNDYRHLLTIVNLLNSNKKHEFNIQGIPVSTDKNITQQITDLANNFVNFANLESIGMKNVPNTTSQKKWDNLTSETQIKTGFEKAQYNLGLPVSNFNAEVINAPLKLVKIESSEKLETDTEIQIIVKVILEKTVNDNIDQLSISVIFNKIKDKISEDTFFKKHKINSEYFISQAFINGFYSNKIENINSIETGIQMKEAKEDNRNQNADITPIIDEIKFIENEYKKRSEDNNYRTSMLDEEGKAFNSSLRFLTDEYYKKNYRTKGGKRVFI